MKNRMKLLAILALAISALGASAPAALAAPPSNDTFTGATPVVVGDSDVIDTTEATTDINDAQLNDSCGAPATDANVWYALDGSDTVVEVDVSQSSYSASVLVGVGSQGNLQPITCGSGGIVPVAFFALAGTTYYVLAIDDQGDGGDNGGLLSISFHLVQ
jgi:streptogramin lyase